jgi:hypothetical protein
VEHTHLSGNAQLERLNAILIDVYLREEPIEVSIHGLCYIYIPNLEISKLLTFF